MHNTPDYLRHFLPMSAALFNFSPNGKVGQILKQLFANAAGTPKAYVVAHRCMIRVWPQPDEQIGDYQPAEIVTRAAQFIREQPGNKGIGDVYESICDIVLRGLSRSEGREEISDVTPIVWSAMPDRVSALSDFVASILMPASLAKILTETQDPDLKDSDLSSFLMAVSNGFDENQRFEAAKAIVDLSPVPLFEKPDGALEFWISAVTDSESRFSIDFLADKSLNDEQRNRVLLQIGDAALASSPASIEALLKDTEHPIARSTLVERLAQVGQACNSMSAKSELAEHMIVSLPSLSGEELHSVARQVCNLGGESALERNGEVLGMLDQEQVEVLVKAFPSSRQLREVQKDFDN
jgi:hypothetical protein